MSRTVRFIRWLVIAVLIVPPVILLTSAIFGVVIALVGGVFGLDRVKEFGSEMSGMSASLILFGVVYLATAVRVMVMILRVIDDHQMANRSANSGGTAS